MADRKAREEIEMRALCEKRLARMDREEREEKLRQVARRVREERTGISDDATSTGPGVGAVTRRTATQPKKVASVDKDRQQVRNRIPTRFPSGLTSIQSRF